MKIQVKTASGAINYIDLSSTGEWRALVLGEFHCLIGGGVSHRFTKEGFFVGTYPVATFLGTTDRRRKAGTQAV